jgi:hypothetical protein
MANIIHILEGWGNYVRQQFDVLDSDTQKLASDRLLYCDSCHMRTGNSCDTQKWDYHVVTKQKTFGCGCNISAKTLSKGSVCPVGKW